MDAPEVIDIGRDAIATLLNVAAPIMLLGLVVGLTIALFQALTQIQEMTLAFVPKILTTFVAVLVFLPFMISTLTDFMSRIADRIISLGLPP